MFNKDFYPTPSGLIRDMFYKVKHMGEIKTILEPSAGKGDIVEYINNSYDFNRNATIDCIELDTELNSFLVGKGHNVVHEDFLTYKTHKRYDLIIMNPPFSEGDKHLLKAIRLMETYGGQIVCLLNAETIKNPFSNVRKELLTELTKHNADIEYKKDAFLMAERKTAVEVALIYISIKKKLEENNIFNEIEFETAEELEQEEIFKMDNCPIRKGDVLFSLVQDYEKEVSFTKKSHSISFAYSLFKASREKGYNVLNSENLNTSLQFLRKKYWDMAIQAETFKKYLTKGSRQAFYERLEKQANIEFNYENLFRLLTFLNQMFINTISEAAESLFVELTKHAMYEYSNNIYLYNGWKTNKACRINKKIILPTYPYKWATDFTAEERVRDLEKVLNYFDGLKHIENGEDYRRWHMKYGEEKTFEYFTIKSYLKGTIHITINRLDLLDKLNIFVGQRKKWLPFDEDIKSTKERKEAEEIIKNISEIKTDKVFIPKQNEYFNSIKLLA